MVAKFSTDPSGQSVVSQETRFPPIFPVAMILILVVAYRSFAAMSAFPVPPGIFVAMASGMFAVAGYVNLRIISSRMDRLIQETLPELDG